jgi:transposase-like protein
MTRQESKSNGLQYALELLGEHGFDGLSEAVSVLWNEVMKLERSEFLGAAPYERSEQREGYANGYKPKVLLSRSGPLELEIPQVRGRKGKAVSFYPRSLEKGERSERALKLAIAEMYVQGVSTRRVTQITQELCGQGVSSTQVSRLSQLLDAELKQWRVRPLSRFPYLMLDARYEKIRHGGSVVDCAVLIAMGVGDDGRRSVLGVSVSLSEAEIHWRDFLKDLQDRGLHGVTYVVSDDHSGIKAALKARFPGVPWNRCQVHLQRNAVAYVPKQEMRAEVAEDLRVIFRSSDRNEANQKLARLVVKWTESAPKLAEWMEHNIPEGLNVFKLPPAHRRRLATTNAVENLNRQLKRRTSVAQLFPSDASLLRLVTAVLIETSEEWETGRIYLNMENV